MQHFYCSNHYTVFCRECIKEDHTDERCFVVDLYEIEKMRKMHKSNMERNQKQLDKRKDEADVKCINKSLPKSHLLGDSQWFVRRKEKLEELKKTEQSSMKVQGKYSIFSNFCRPAI